MAMAPSPTELGHGGCRCPSVLAPGKASDVQVLGIP